jgi:beta-1,4-N-acetylglucosaminyltransferase
MKNMPIKIAIAASPGGHLVQVRQLAPLYEKYPHFFFTFSNPVAAELSKTAKVYAICNMVRCNPWSWVSGFYQSLRVAIKERPDVILTTGAGVVVMFCFLSKILGAKVIFIESMAKIESPTLTARLLYPIADLFIVQWPKLKSHFPRAHYWGRLL